MALFPEPDEVSLAINGKTFRGWTEIEITRVFDGHDTVSFSAPFEPENSEFRDTFRPFSFQGVEVQVGGITLFSGTMIDVSPEVTESERRVGVTAYSRAAILADCTVPASALPLEFNNLTLKQITEKLVEPFGVALAAAGPSDGSPFKRVALDPGTKIQEFLADLAKQRGLVLASNSDGDLEYRKSSTGTQKPVAKLTESSPVISVGASFSPQDYYSEITCVLKNKGGRKGSKYTEQNPFFDTLRPVLFELDDTDPGDIKVATAAKLGRMFGNVVSYDIELCTWFTPDDKLWEPDQRIALTAPGVMVYQESELMIRAVKLKQDNEKKRTASLNCCLPGAFNGEVPGDLPWLG